MLQSVREVGIEEGIEIGMKIGMEKGRLIGEILVAQRILKQPVYSEQELKIKGIDELKRLLSETEMKLEGGKKMLQSVREVDIEEGMKKGRLIGEILMAQRVIRQAVYSEQELKIKSIDELKRLLSETEMKIA